MLQTSSHSSYVFKLLWELKCNESIFVIAPEAYSEPSEKSKTEHFVKRVESFQALTIFTKPPVLNIWLDYENNSEFPIHIIKSDRSVLNFSFSHQMLMFTVMSYTRDELHTWWATHVMSYTRDELHTWPINIKANYSKYIFNY